MRTRHLIVTLSLIAASGQALSAQVTVSKGAVVYHGSASNTTAPAILVEKKVREATPEWQKIQDESIDPDSAHGQQLLVKMNKRIREAVKQVAADEGRDMVTRKKDLTDDRGREVVDLTAKVVQKLKE